MNASKTRKATLKDVAKETGLSCATISRTLNNNFDFPETTRKKVWDAVNKLNYTPNAQARRFRAGGDGGERIKSGICMHISHMGRETLDGDTFESQRSLMLSWEAQQRDLYMISYWYYKRKGFRCPPMLNGHIDGAIIGTPHHDIVDIVKNKIPVVLMDVPFSPDILDVPTVNVDFNYGFSMLLKHLREHGHQRIGIMSDNTVGESNQSSMMHSIRESAGHYGMQIAPEADITEDINPVNHDEVMSRVAKHFAPLIEKRKITAIISPGMGYAASLYKAFVGMGIKVPETISLATVQSQISPPEYDITCVKYNWEKLIKTSLEVLNNLIDDKDSYCREYLIKPDFFQGNTVGTAK